MNYAPVNELGVVLLFAQIAKRYRLRVDHIQAAFPDCVAYQTIGGREKKIRIEFEYRSKSFVAHGHDPRKCDMIVCWEHDWTQCPPNIQVLELRREFGLGFNVWLLPVGKPYSDQLSRESFNDGWTVPPRAHEGDLVLFYRTRPEHYVADVFRVAGPVRWERSGLTRRPAGNVKRGWRATVDHFAAIRRVCRLSAPVHFEDLKNHRVLGSAGFVRGKMRGRWNASEYWPYLHAMIIRRNPSVRKTLGRYAPERLGL